MKAEEFLKTIDNRIIRYGDSSRQVSTVRLRAGVLDLLYMQGNLRHISLGNKEILRMIYPAVRGKGWITAAPKISNEKIDALSDSFTISYTCRYRLHEIDFEANYRIEGKSDNSIVFEMEGRALSTFMKNRLGFCVLHPIRGLAGTECRIKHSDASLEILPFPERVAPHAPFKDIAAMTWSGDGSYEAALTFFGDVFETEDQRNWTDTSYKTFCTPLSRPYPVEVKEGEKIYQRVELKVRTDERPATMQSQHTVTVFPENETPMPKIGIGRTTREEPITDDEMALLGKLQFFHYRVDLYLFQRNWRRIANEAFVEADMMNYRLEIALFFDENHNEQVLDFCEWAEERSSQISHIIIFDKTAKATPDQLIAEVLDVMKNKLPGVAIGAGTNANFVQLNRNPPRSASLDFLAFSIQPQEHAFDNLTIIENAEAQHYTVETGKFLAGSRSLRVSPVTLQRRFNANVENFESPALPGTMPWQVDNRIMSMFCAQWTVASFRNIAASGAESVTFYETVGARGIVQGEYPNPWPGSFHSFPGMVYPVFHIFHYLLARRNWSFVQSTVSDNLSIESLVLKKGKRLAIVLVNFMESAQQVLINGIDGPGEIVTFGPGQFREAVQHADWLTRAVPSQINLLEPMILEPSSICFIDMKLH